MSLNLDRHKSLNNYWVDYNNLVQPYLKSIYKEIATDLIKVETPRMKSLYDNYLMVQSKKGLDHLLSDKFKKHEVKSIAFLPDLINQAEIGLSNFGRKLFPNNVQPDISVEFWMRGNENFYNNIKELTKLSKDLESIDPSYEFITEKNFVDKDLKKYEESFIVGFKEAQLLPSDSSFYVKAFLNPGNNINNSKSFSIGIKDVRNNKIAACSFLLIGSSKTNPAKKIAYLHGDTVISKYRGKHLQRYLIEYRKIILKKQDIKPENTFVLVDKESASYKNYLATGFEEIDKTGVIFYQDKSK
jgi:hypothetical protein